MSGVDQKILPCGQGRIDSVKINPSLLMMRECTMQRREHSFRLWCAMKNLVLKEKFGRSKKHLDAQKKIGRSKKFGC